MYVKKTPKKNSESWIYPLCTSSNFGFTEILASYTNSLGHFYKVI